MRRNPATHLWASSRTGPSGLLIALALISGIVDQVCGAPGPWPDVIRDGDRDRDRDPGGVPLEDPGGPEDADPVEDGEPGGEGESSGLAAPPSGRVARRSRRLPACPRPPASSAVSARRPAPRGGNGANPPASGRTLRHWLRSQIC